MSKKNFTMYLDEEAVKSAKEHVKRNGGSLGGAVSEALTKAYYIDENMIDHKLYNTKTRKEKYKDYLKSDAWKNLREFAKFKNKRENDNILTCEDCGKSKNTIFNVHHEQYPDKLEDDNPKYHVVLCERCHKIRHDLIELSEEEEGKIREDLREKLANIFNNRTKK